MTSPNEANVTISLLYKDLVSAVKNWYLEVPRGFKLGSTA